MLDKTDIQRIAISSLGAVALTTASFFAAAAPVRAEAPIAPAPNAPATVADWQQGVERQLHGSEDAAATKSSKGRGHKVVVSARFTADGDYAGSQIAQSSGIAAIDRQALNVADHVAYPAMPAGYRGQPLQVTVRLYFGTDQQVADAAKRDGQLIMVQNQAGGAGMKLTAK